MTATNTMGFRALIDEMKAVTDGRIKPVVRADKHIYASPAARTFVAKLSEPSKPGPVKKPAPFKTPSHDGITVLRIERLAGVARLITPENQELLQIIAGGGVESVADLAAKSHRDESNLSRTLKKLWDVGVITYGVGVGRSKIPQLAVQSFQVRVDVVSGMVQLVSAVAPGEASGARASASPQRPRTALASKSTGGRRAR
jgi:predicted transcriptional regulator